MAKKNESYDNNSIKQLKGADRVRKRPGVIFGSDGIEGCEHSVFEIISNSIDEAREGHGDVITVTRFKDKSIMVEDHGRGMPVGYNEKEQEYNWKLLFCELYAGGKYNTNDGENYEYSLGLNGLGLCSTQYSSEYMDAVIYSDGMKHTLHFEKGENVGGLQSEKTTQKKTGTTIRWRPDLDVFTDIDIPYEYFDDVLRRQAVVNSGVLFVLKNEISEGFETTEYKYDNGIVDYVNEFVGEDTITPVKFLTADRKGRDREDNPEYKLKITLAFCFSSNHNLLEYYHNSSFLEHGGSPDKAVKSAFVSRIDAFIKSANKYNKNESKVTFADIADCLVLVSSNFSTYSSYENQTKKSITNKFITEAMTEFLRHQLDVYFIEKPDEANKIVDRVLINKRSRESAEKARQTVKNTLVKALDLSNRVQKFADCRTKDVSRREVYIVEGDSALGSVKQARNAEFQAVMPVRGKILNCLKADETRIFKSEIITDLMKVLGCGVELKSKRNKDLSSFNLNSLRWNKIIICTDADVDGYHIRTLILNMLFALAPTLIEKGYVYIAESPLYEITTADMTYFAYSDKEKADILAKIGKTKYTVQRSKGLGENEADMMSLTTMNPETRRLIKVTPEDAEKTVAMFDLMLGDNLQGRKDYISKHGQEFLDLADIS